MAEEWYKSVVGFSIAGNYAAIVQHWLVVDPGGAGPFSRAKALAEGMDTPSAGGSYFDSLKDLMSADCFISSVRAHRIGPSSGNEWGRVYPADVWVGSFAGDIQGPQVACCLIHLTAAEAGLTGRTFIPGVPSTGLDEGRFNDAFKTELDEFVTIFLDGIQTAIGTFLPGIKNGGPFTVTRIVNCQLSPTPGTMRRRLKPV
jgi:hypothetical protein